MRTRQTPMLLFIALLGELSAGAILSEGLALDNISFMHLLFAAVLHTICTGLTAAVIYNHLLFNNDKQGKK